MANLNALKNLFSKLKPAAKTVANYGDNAAKALTTYGDDAARMAFANADDLAGAAAQTDDIAKLISDADVPTDVPNRMWINGASNAPEQSWYRSPNYVDRPTPKQVLQQADYDSPYGSTDLVEKYADSEFSDDVLEMMADDHIDLVYNTQTRPVGSFTKPGNTDELVSYLNNADAEFDSLSQLDPNAYKSGLDGRPEKFVIAPELFGGYGGYDNRLVGSFNYPDGFINPDSAAMYYDSLERGYIPAGYLDAGNEIRWNWARDGASKRAYGLPDLYEELQTELGLDAFSNANKSDAYKKIHPRTFKRMLMRRP